MLSSILFPLWDEKRNVVVLDSFFDESGKDDGRIIIVSGYVGSSKLMHQLARDWKDVLRDYKVEYWHTSRFRNPNSKLFKHLSKSRRKRLVRELVTAINRRTLMGVTVVMDKERYLSLTSPRFRSQWGAPYVYCVELALIAISTFLKSEGRHDELINILLEEGHKNAEQAIHHIKILKEDAATADIRPLNVGEYGLGEKRKQPALQAADMLAYSSFEEHRKLRRKPEIFGRLVATKRPRYYWREVTAEIIEGSKAGIAALFRDGRLGKIILNRKGRAGPAL